MSTPEIRELSLRISAILEPATEVIGAYLFGSRASSDARPDADVDLGILFDSPGSLARSVELEQQLEDELGLEVDVVDLGRARPFLALEAIRGERIFERDGLRLDRFDLFVLRRAGDLAPFREGPPPATPLPGERVSPGRIRTVVVADKIAVIERMLAGIATLPLDAEASFLDDPRMVAAGESFLRRSLEALSDLGRHLLAKAFGQPVAEYKQIASLLSEHAVLEPDLAGRLRSMAGYRNRLVRVYDEVMPEELYRILTHDLDDIRDIVAALQSWIAAHSDQVDSGL